MPRDPGLEELVNDTLGSLAGLSRKALSEKAMFGGWAWLLHGNLLCGARRGSMLIRLGKDHEAWAVDLPGINPMVMRGRRMPGWVRAMPEAYANDALRQRLLAAAVHFTNTLPKK